MSDAAAVSGHYASGALLTRLEDALHEDGVDPGAPTLATLAPYDHFHGRGLEATEEMVELLAVSAADHLLDLGSGLGGPARYLAERFGCRVTGIDLTAEFCAVGRRLTRLLGLDARVVLEEGDALAMPFGPACFDGAYSMNVSMNIADKGALHRAVHRVLKPGGWLLLSEVARGSGDGPDYPTPWAASGATSFLATLAETREGLEASGFSVETERETAAAALAYGARSRALVERGGKPLHRAVTLIHGDLAPAAIANVAEALREGRIVPVEFLCRKI